MGLLTVTVEDRDRGYVAIHELMNDVEYRGLHPRSFKVLVRAKIERTQRFPQQLGLTNVDCNKFQDAVLCDYADNHGAFSFIVDVY